MITDEQLDDLPDDDREAFVAFEAILRQWLSDHLNNASWDNEREYVTYILAFADARGIDLGLDDKVPDSQDQFTVYYTAFLRNVDRYKARVRLDLSAARKSTGTSFRIAGNFKTQIGGHLTAIRSIVHEADLPEKKRDAIFKQVEKLQLEVDRDRTKADVAMGLWLDITSAISNGAKNLDPAIDRLDRIMKIFSEARDDSAAKLPAPEERKRIPPPSGTPTDDEIPF